MNDYQKRRFNESHGENDVQHRFGQEDCHVGLCLQERYQRYTESAAIYICRDLLQERARIAIYDPRVPESQVRADLHEVFAISLAWWQRETAG